MVKITESNELINPISGETRTSLAAKFGIHVLTLNKYIKRNKILSQKIKNDKENRRNLFTWEVKLICEVLGFDDVTENNNNLK